MTGTQGGGTTNQTTVTRDTVTILLEGKSIPGVYMSIDRSIKAKSDNNQSSHNPSGNSYLEGM
jgi:hypothetical protein